ncbi:MAG: hypothetical protein QXJ28_02990 [Candidatus Pacearchaeota archaeon]
MNNQEKKQIGYKVDGTYYDLLWIIRNDGDLQEFKSLYYEDYEWFEDKKRLNLFTDAAFYGRNDIAEYMLLSSYKEDLYKTFEYRDDWDFYKKENVLLVAAKYGNIDLVEFILEIAPYLAEETDDQDNNILHLLLKYSPEQYRTIAEIIRKYKLHELYFQQNSSKRTPIDCLLYTTENVLLQAVHEAEVNAEIESETNVA